MLTFCVEGDIGRGWVLHLVAQIVGPRVAHVQIGGVQPAGIQHERMEAVGISVAKA